MGFVRFLEEVTTQKFHFEFYWPLSTIPKDDKNDVNAMIFWKNWRHQLSRNFEIKWPSIYFSSSFLGILCFDGNQRQKKNMKEENWEEFFTTHLDKNASNHISFFDNSNSNINFNNVAIFQKVQSILTNLSHEHKLCKVCPAHYRFW